MALVGIAHPHGRFVQPTAPPACTSLSSLPLSEVRDDVIAGRIRLGSAVGAIVHQFSVPEQKPKADSQRRLWRGLAERPGGRSLSDLGPDSRGYRFGDEALVRNVAISPRFGGALPLD
jgi:hypothetical protein